MAKTFELISSVTVGSGGASSIDFTSIPSTYTDLVVKLSARGAQSAEENILLTINGTSTTYTNKTLRGAGSGTPASYSFPTNSLVGFADGSTNTASTFSSTEIYLPNYTGSAQKSYSVDSVTESNATTSYQLLIADLWSGTSAITSLSLAIQSSTFVQYSTAYLYGVKNA